MKKLIMIMAAAALTSAACAELTAEEIVNKANQAAYYAGDDGRAEVEMTISSKGGPTRTRKFSLLRMNTANGNKSRPVGITSEFPDHA